MQGGISVHNALHDHQSSLQMDFKIMLSIDICTQIIPEKSKTCGGETSASRLSQFIPQILRRCRFGGFGQFEQILFKS